MVYIGTDAPRDDSQCFFSFMRKDRQYTVFQACISQECTSLLIPIPEHIDPRTVVVDGALEIEKHANVFRTLCGAFKDFRILIENGQSPLFSTRKIYPIDGPRLITRHEAKEEVSYCAAIPVHYQHFILATYASVGTTMPFMFSYKAYTAGDKPFFVIPANSHLTGRRDEPWNHMILLSMTGEWSGSELAGEMSSIEKETHETRDFLTGDAFFVQNEKSDEPAERILFRMLHKNDRLPPHDVTAPYHDAFYDLADGQSVPTCVGGSVRCQYIGDGEKPTVRCRVYNKAGSIILVNGNVIGYDPQTRQGATFFKWGDTTIRVFIDKREFVVIVDGSFDPRPRVYKY